MKQIRKVILIRPLFYFIQEMCIVNICHLTVDFEGFETDCLQTPDFAVCPLLGCTESLPDILRELESHLPASSDQTIFQNSSTVSDPSICPLLGCTESLSEILRDIRTKQDSFLLTDQGVIRTSPAAAAVDSAFAGNDPRTWLAHRFEPSALKPTPFQVCPSI